MTVALLMAVLSAGCGASQGQAGGNAMASEHTSPSGLHCGQASGSTRHHARGGANNAVDGFDTGRCHTPANEDLRH